MPGYQPQTPRWPKCSLCGGVDLGNFGVIAHRRDCRLNPDRELLAAAEDRRRAIEAAIRGNAS